MEDENFWGSNTIFLCIQNKMKKGKERTCFKISYKVLKKVLKSFHLAEFKVCNVTKC